MHRIILVDDDRTNTTLISMLLEMDGFVVVACPDVERAQQAAADGADAFIIDCHLAHGDDGIELLRSIRVGLTGADPQVPVIMTSGDDSRSGDAELTGATRFLVKPYSPGTLSTHLSELLGHG
jgi:DNA-binding response OmpR family regulator